MTNEEEREIWRKVHEDFAQQKQKDEEKRKQDAIKRREEGKSHPCDWGYFTEEDKALKIAHQDEKIAHPDTMRKTPATILLIVGMIGSLIFKQWYLVWIILLWWYFSKDRV